MSQPINHALTALATAALVLVGSALAASDATTTTPTTTATAPAASPSDTGSAAKAAASAAAAKAATEQQTQQQHLATIKTKGDAEINRRLTQLKSLDSLISSSTRITAADRSALTAQVNTEISGLATLETHLSGETTLAAAEADAQSIYSDYRVYALITPKIHLIKVADDQQVTEANLATIAIKLQSRLTAAQASGQYVTTLQANLTDLNAQVKAAQAISGAIENGVIGLQPSDYNANHSVLSGDAAQLQVAHKDNQTAFADATAILLGLKSLSGQLTPARR